MAVLSFKQILQDNNTTDPFSITALSLTHKALSDVSCLSEFKNLERLDLAFNNLTSLEGLKSCVNLKWLSVKENKLESLKGIERLTKLTVLNAGKNKLRSVQEVGSLVSLCALILNDNEIATIGKLDHMKELNTIVLSRNPVREICESIVKVKSLTKLSLSNCQLQNINPLLKSCTELKELRLAHNEIKNLPMELAQNTKLLNLDLGNNLITRSSDVEVLSSSVNLRNLNLQGNPICASEKSTKKIKTLVPNLRIYNGRPTDKPLKIETRVDYDDSFPNFDQNPKRKKNEQLNEMKIMPVQEDETNLDFNLETESKQKKKKKEKDSDDKKKSKKVDQNVVSLIDDAETSFVDFFANENLNTEKKIEGQCQTNRYVDKGDVLVSLKKKKIKNKNITGSAAHKAITETNDVGLGGQSTWDDV
jgi:protein phosphatase 1 regulatory subunit 7